MGKHGERRYKAEQVLEAIKDSAGIVSNVARKLGCDWHTARRYIDEYTSAQAAFDGEMQRVNDLGEIELIKLMQSGDLGAIKYRLSSKAKDRGYGEQMQITGTGKAGAFLLGWAEDDTAEDQGHPDNQNGLPPASKAA